ncbi:macrophage mannose receptor 1-like [Mytilus edulis]|uniref:macrophage mannose receptor 1-like n=1 Tax=Mytilus edulis TaxID=6550 RepID=UPI0039EE5B50
MHLAKDGPKKEDVAMEDHVVNVRKNEDIWTGLYSPTSDENFEFVDAGGALTLDTLPFGGRDQIDNEDCVEFELKTSNNWNWDDDPCDRPQQYMCEFEMANCNVLGGHLTSIETGDENAFLVDVIALMQENTEEIRLAFFWIGLTDNNDEMSYKWSSCEPLNYTEWYQGPPQQPDNRNFINQQDAHCCSRSRD